MAIGASLAEKLALLDPEDRKRALDEIAPTPEAKAALKYRWDFWARPNQLPPPGDWFVWLFLAGRGSGKTRTAVEWIRHRIAQGAQRLVLIGRTAGDIRATMLEGESGILTCTPPWERPKYEPSKQKLTWPNGATALLFSADKPDQVRGQNIDTAWCDELAAWRYPDAWDQLMLATRSMGAGLEPQVMVSTTPRPTDLIKELVKDSSTHVTRGSTFDNIAHLAPRFIAEVKKRYEGTRIGQQEIYGEILEDNPGALWTYDMINDNRVEKAPPDLDRIVVGVDPAVTSNARSDETGIVVVGLKEHYIAAGKWNRHAYVLEDLSGKYSTNDWARKVVSIYRKYKANAIVCEVNNGGDLVTANILNCAPTARVIPVRASKGKIIRAEPAAMLYEQGRVHHTAHFADLEDQLTSWDPILKDEQGKPVPSKKSPDRLDALVWALYELIIKDARGEFSNEIPVPKSPEQRAEEEARKMFFADRDDW